jgi:hypothetical protein
MEIYFSDPPVLERLTSATYLYIEGHATGKNSDTSIVLQMEGTFSYCPSVIAAGFECAVAPVSCQSGNHTLTLTRR